VTDGERAQWDRLADGVLKYADHLLRQRAWDVPEKAAIRARLKAALWRYVLTANPELTRPA
jgi:hypothetical protein